MAKKQPVVKPIAPKTGGKIKLGTTQSTYLDRILFNFSYITAEKKYNLKELSKKYKHQLFSKLEYLSTITMTDVKMLHRENGIEYIETLKREVVPTQFKNSDKFDDCISNYAVFRAGSDLRVIGKLNRNTFYVIAIDTTFSLYDH